MVKVGDILNGGVFGLELRVMKVIGDKIITVHLDEWKVLQTDDLNRYASIHSFNINEIGMRNESNSRA